jgi:hypothetical protein
MIIISTIKMGIRPRNLKKCPYWPRDASEVVCKELSKLLDYADPKVITTKFSSICDTTLSIVAGVDQGQGAWQSWIRKNGC